MCEPFSFSEPPLILDTLPPDCSRPHAAPAVSPQPLSISSCQAASMNLGSTPIQRSLAAGDGRLRLATTAETGQKQRKRVATTAGTREGDRCGMRRDGRNVKVGGTQWRRPWGSGGGGGEQRYQPSHCPKTPLNVENIPIRYPKLSNFALPCDVYFWGSFFFSLRETRYSLTVSFLLLNFTNVNLGKKKEIDFVSYWKW